MTTTTKVENFPGFSSVSGTELADRLLEQALGQGAEDEALERLRGARLDAMSPIEAMNLLYELQRMLEP